MKKESLEILELEMAMLVRRITSINTDKKAEKKIGNLDRSAYLLLNHMTTCGGSGVKALAEAFRLDISTVSRQVAALEQKGFVYRIPDPQDGRAYSLQLTELGSQELEAYKQALSAKLGELLDEWTDEEALRFAELLRKFNLTISKKLESSGSG